MAVRMLHREMMALPVVAEAVRWCCHPPGQHYSPSEPNSLCTAQRGVLFFHSSLSPSFWLPLRRGSTPSVKPHGPGVTLGLHKPIALILFCSQLQLGHCGGRGRRCSFVCCLLVKGRTEHILPWIGQSIFNWMGIGDLLGINWSRQH